jgi:hypothetical protein
MLTVVLFAVVLLSILGMLLGKAAISYLLRPSRTVTYIRCAVLEWAAFALSVVSGLVLIFANVTADAHNALRRAACMVVIAGAELVAVLLLFGAVSLIAGVIVLAVAWRRHLARAVLAALLANLAMTGVALATAILLISPAPYLTVWQAPAERTGRSLVCYPPWPPVAPPPRPPDAPPPATSERGPGVVPRLAAARSVWTPKARRCLDHEVTKMTKLTKHEGPEGLGARLEG